MAAFMQTAAQATATALALLLALRAGAEEPGGPHGVAIEAVGTVPAHDQFSAGLGLGFSF